MHSVKNAGIKDGMTKWQSQQKKFSTRYMMMVKMHSVKNAGIMVGTLLVTILKIFGHN